MHFGPNECTQCGCIRAAYTSSEYELPSDGVFARLLGYECAFCSDKCIEKALQPYIAERFGFNKDPKNDPDIRGILENYQNAVKLIDSNTLHSVEERAELEEHRAYHYNGLKEALASWIEAKNYAIDAAVSQFISQWARDCGAYSARQSEKSFVERKREIERQQQDEERRRERERLEAKRDQERAEREAQRLRERYESQQEREERERKRKQEVFEREWDKDYFAALPEHEQFLEREAHEQTLIFKPIPDHLRIHTGIVAKTGWGKTQLLQTLILWELKKPDPPSLIVLDSTGQMVELIQRLAVFNDRLRDRILIIDPAHSPSLNMFDLSTPRFETYTREQKEDIQNEIVNLFNYVFSSEDYKLTGQMAIGFAYAVRLILSRPNSTIRDLRRLLEEDCRRCEQSAFAADIAELDEDAQDFFRNHFYSDELKKTRAAIARRLQLMVSIPAFARMFITSRNALDLYGETQDKRSIILVNTNERLLKEGGYILFGRYIVARTMAAILERASIPREQRTITHLIIDEGSPYMDETFDTLLTRVRQYGLKVTIAFQHFQQLTDKLKNSVAGQTSVKYAGGLSYQDARFLANDMRCEADFLTSLKTDIGIPPKWTQFAVYADNWNDNHPMLVTLPFLTMEREPKMTPDQYAALLARNRQRIAPAPQIKNHQLSWWFDGEPLKAVLKDSATFGMGLWDH